MRGVRILPFGDRALLVEFAGLSDTIAATALLEQHPIDDVIDVVPGARTVLVRLGAGRGGLTALEQRLARLFAELESPTVGAGEVPAPADRVVRIPVEYDGEDLAAVAEAWGCSVDEVVRRHAATEWVCAFVGFAPGFPYLVPVDAEPLPAVPRRATSRARVPAGAVALAAEYCGVYPRESPGGWQVIGRTDAPLWDTGRATPALITAGTRVRFTPVVGGAGGAPGPAGRSVSQESSIATPGNSGQDSGARTSFPEKRHAPSTHGAASQSVRVLEPGALTLVHDLGRPGLARLGVGASGAFDRAAHRLANRLVGNDEGAAAFEVLLGGATIALPAGAWLAVTGASGTVTLDGVAVPPAVAVRAERDGAELRLGPASRGVRYSVAVRGGLDVPAELGSRSRDTLAALGPAPLAAGDTVALANEVAGPIPAVDLFATDAALASATELTVRPGPRRDWFTDASWERMLHEAWTVSARADRTGIRLDGPSLERQPEAFGRELPSEGMLTGALQVSPDGVPTILGPDHPVTGGYPVIAVVTDDARDRLAQLRPGDPVRLRLATGRP